MKYTDDIIRDYVLGRLDADASKALKDEAGRNPDLKKRIRMEHYIQQGVEHFVLSEYKDKVGRLVRERRARRRRIYVGLALIALALMAVLYMLSGESDGASTPDNQQLYAQYFEAPKLLSGTRSEENLELIDELRRLYGRGEWDKLEEATDGVMLWQDDPEIALMRMIALIETGQPEVAIAVRGALQTSDPLYDDHLDWYTALAWLRMGDTGEAVEILYGIAPDPEHDHHDEAVRLLESLR